jgi:hypothetical protein
MGILIAQWPMPSEGVTMHRPLVASIAFAFLCGILSAFPARAATFDLIYCDHYNLTLCDWCALTLGPYGFGLVVNKGLTDIEGPEFFGTTFSVISSRPEVTLLPFINDPLGPVTPIHPNEAVGSVQAPNAILTSLVLPGETFRNTAAMQVIGFGVVRLPVNEYVGPVSFDVTMTMGDQVAHFTLFMNVALGASGVFDIQFQSAARVHSTPIPTPTAARTWGALKALYR